MSVPLSEVSTAAVMLQQQEAQHAAAGHPRQSMRQGASRRAAGCCGRWPVFEGFLLGGCCGVDTLALSWHWRAHCPVPHVSVLIACAGTGQSAGVDGAFSVPSGFSFLVTHVENLCGGGRGSLKSLTDVWGALEAALCCALAGALGFGLFYFAVDVPKLPGHLPWSGISCERVGGINLSGRGW